MLYFFILPIFFLSLIYKFLFFLFIPAVYFFSSSSSCRPHQRYYTPLLCSTPTNAAQHIQLLFSLLYLQTTLLFDHLIQNYYDFLAIKDFCLFFIYICFIIFFIFFLFIIFSSIWIQRRSEIVWCKSRIIMSNIKGKNVKKKRWLLVVQSYYNICWRRPRDVREKIYVRYFYESGLRLVLETLSLLASTTRGGVYNLQPYTTTTTTTISYTQNSTPGVHLNSFFSCICTYTRRGASGKQHAHLFYYIFIF